MDFAEQKKQELEERLRETLLFGEAKSVVEYDNFTKNITIGDTVRKIWTDAFRVALKENEHIYIPQGKYYLDDTVVIPSNRKITADKNAFVCIVKGTKVVMFRNEHVIDGSARSVGMQESHSENIVIDGGIWATEYNCRAEYGAIGAFDNEDSKHGVHALMLFSGVKNLWVKNAVYKNTATFALQIGRTENFLIENLTFDDCYADGVHLNGEIKNGVVFNIKGHTEDDLVALNAYDWDNSTINNGFIENVTVSRIYSTGGHCHCMRVLSGVTREEMGNIDCYIKNVHISYITGVQTFKMYLQTPPYVGIPEGAKVGRTEDITFENIEIVKTRPSDNGQNYFDKDPITGHFGGFEISENINNLTLRNISFRLEASEYKDTAHFMVVGPKSWYIKEENLEIFDPYLTSTVKNLRYENIKIDGKEVCDLKSYVKEVSFDRLYDSEYASGFGKVENILKI